MKKAMEFLILIGFVGIALSAFGMSSLVTQKFDSALSIFYWSFDLPGYLKQLSTNVDSLSGIFTGDDLDVSSHLDFTNVANQYISIVNVIIFAINFILVLPLKLGAFILTFMASFIGIKFEGSALDWVFQIFNFAISSDFAIPYVPLYFP